MLKYNSIIVSRRFWGRRVVFDHRSLGEAVSGRWLDNSRLFNETGLLVFGAEAGRLDA